MARADAMCSSRVVRRRVYEVDKPQLSQVKQSPKLGRIHYVAFQAVQQYWAVHVVLELENVVEV
jgi:hypothetical protein